MAEITVNGQQYISHKLNVFDQADLLRVMAPIWSGIAEAVKSGTLQFEPIAKALNSLSKPDFFYVLNLCLSSVTRKQGEVFVKISAGNNRLMFDDIGLGEMMQITWEVLQENFAPFSLGLPAQNSTAAPKA